MHLQRWNGPCVNTHTILRTGVHNKRGVLWIGLLNDEPGSQNIKRCNRISIKMSSTTANNEVKTVTFNVGGTRYEVSRSLLEEYPNSMLYSLASGKWNEDPCSSEIFIERDGERFKYCLDFLRDRKAVLPLAVAKKVFLNDLEYYGIEVDGEHPVEYAHEDKEFEQAVSLVLIDKWTEEALRATVHGLSFKLAVAMYWVKVRECRTRDFDSICIRSDTDKKTFDIVSTLSQYMECYRFTGVVRQNFLRFRMAYKTISFDCDPKTFEKKRAVVSFDKGFGYTDSV